MIARIIQGDGIDFDSLIGILAALENRGWSADNIAFGSGGGLLQKLNRDTLKFAFKCSSATIHGAERDVFKQPITDTGKRSKAGRLKLVRDRDGYRTVAHDAAGEDQLVEVFRDGRIWCDWTFSRDSRTGRDCRDDRDRLPARNPAANETIQWKQAGGSEPSTSPIPA